MARAEGLLPSAEGLLRIEVIFSPAPRSVWHWRGQLAAGSLLQDALQASGVLQLHPEIAAGGFATGIWSRAATLSQPLADRDRVEIYRPLLVDPKEARRLRYRQQREGPEAPPGKRAVKAARRR